MGRKVPLSERPGQIRNRLRRNMGKVQSDVDMYIEKSYKKPIEQWDLEELARGRPRSKSGDFRGRTPEWINATVQREAKRRLLDHTFGQLAGHVDLAIITIGNLLKSKAVDDFGRPLVDARTKLAAAQFIIENIIGKPKAVVEIEGADVVKQFLANALVLDDGEAAHPVIDGHFTANEDDEDDEEGYDDDDPDE